MNSSRTLRILSAVSFAIALPFAVGCAQETTAAPASPESAQASEAGGPLASRRPHGPAFLLVAALHNLDLSDAQKATIEAALEKAAPAPREHSTEEHAVFKVLAEGVRKGAIDEAAVSAAAREKGDPRSAHSAQHAEALATLHATLTPEQRRALVDLVAKRGEERGPGGEHHGKRGDHGPRGDHDGASGERGHRGAHGKHGGPLAHLLRDLDLSDAQRAEVHKALEAQKPADMDHDAMKAKFEAKRAAMKTRLEAFAADTFDAASFVKPPADADGPGEHGPRAHLDRMVKGLQAVLPILEPAQREKLATQIEKGPPGREGPEGRRGHGHHRGGRAL